MMDGGYPPWQPEGWYEILVDGDIIDGIVTKMVEHCKRVLLYMQPL